MALAYNIVGRRGTTWSMMMHEEEQFIIIATIAPEVLVSMN